MLAFALLSSALAAPPGWTLAPFGIGAYVHGKPVRGVVYSATQAAGIATAAVATAQAYDAVDAEDDAAFEQWQGVSIAGVSVAAVSYLVSVIDGSRLHELEKEGETARARVERWDAAMARRPSGSDRDPAAAFAAKER